MSNLSSFIANNTSAQHTWQESVPMGECGICIGGYEQTVRNLAETYRCVCYPLHGYRGVVAHHNGSDLQQGRGSTIICNLMSRRQDVERNESEGPEGGVCICGSQTLGSIGREANSLSRYLPVSTSAANRVASKHTQTHTHTQTTNMIQQHTIVRYAPRREP